MLILSLVLTVVLEATFTTIPLTLLLLLVYAVHKNDVNVLFFGFFSGLFLDILRLDTLGLTSFYFLIALSLVLMYKRKFETESTYYLLVFSFLGVLVYSLYKGLSNPLSQAILSTVLSLLVYKIFIKREEKGLEWQK